jgi:hypothetical protein
MQRAALLPCGGLTRSVGRALLLRHVAASALKADAGWIRTPITAQPSTRLPVSPDASDVVAIRIVAYDQIAPADWLCTT